VPERIGEHPVAIAPELVGDRHQHGGPGVDRALEQRIDILDVEMQRHRRPAKAGRRPHGTGKFVDDEEAGVAEQQGGWPRVSGSRSVPERSSPSG
jgi:hypothetical protein